MKKLYVVEGGCEGRGLETARLINYFKKNGCQITKNPGSADILLLSTCAVTQSKEDSNVERIRFYQQHGKMMIVSGCLGAINPERLEDAWKDSSKRKIVLLPKELEKIDKYFPEHRHRLENCKDENIPIKSIDKEEKGPLSRLFLKFGEFCHHVAKQGFDGDLISKINLFFSQERGGIFFIQISNGCNKRCSYCGIRKATGNFKSKPKEEILAQFEKGLKQKYRIFKLLGDDITSYGSDMGTNLIELLQDMTRIPGEFKIYLESGDPSFFLQHENEFSHLFRSRKIRYVNLGIQTCSPRVLKLMKRSYYDSEKLSTKIRSWRNQFPHLLIDINLIVGFPTVSREEFIENLRIIKNSRCYRLFLFPFHLVPDTEAEKLEPKISPNEIIKRIGLANSFFSDSDIILEINEWDNFQR